MNLPSDIANQALDAIGSDVVIGDLEEGTREAQVLLRAYGQCLRQLLRAAHWDFARKQAPLTLLADASGQTPEVGNAVIYPWLYEYAYPIDCMKARFVPANWPGVNPPAPPGNYAIGSAPIMTGLGSNPLAGQRIRPARFTIATDSNYAPPAGGIDWETQGVSPQGRTVVCTNIQYASLIYTALILYPSVWDVNFRAALVAYLASETALAIWAKKDRKFGLEMRGQQIQIAKTKIAEARVADGNEGWYSSDIRVDWMDFRRAGGFADWGGRGFGGPGVLGYGWDRCGFADGSAY